MMYKWSEDWQMVFNIDKCKLVPSHWAWKQPHIIPIRKNRSPYCFPAKHIGVTENLNVSEQCAKITKTANKVLGI